MLLLHERQRRALRTAVGRIGVAARGIGLRLRIGRAFHHALIGVLAVGLEMFVPALGQIGIKLGRVLRAGWISQSAIAVLTATDEAWLGTLAELDVHGVVSFAAGTASGGR